MRFSTVGSLVLISLFAYACSSSEEEPVANGAGAAGGDAGAAGAAAGQAGAGAAGAGAAGGGLSGNGGKSGQSGNAGQSGKGGGGGCDGVACSNGKVIVTACPGQPFTSCVPAVSGVECVAAGATCPTGGGGTGGKGGTGGSTAGTGGSTAGTGGTGVAGKGGSGACQGDGVYCTNGNVNVGPCPGQKITACDSAVSGVACVISGETCPKFPACAGVTAGATCVPGTSEDCLVAGKTVAQCSADGTWWVGTLVGAEPATSACDVHGTWGFTYAEPLDPKADCSGAPLTLEVRDVKGMRAVLVQPAATSSLVMIYSNGCDAHLEATYPASAGASPGDTVTTVAQLSFADPPSGTYSRIGSGACGSVSTKGTFASFAKQ